MELAIIADGTCIHGEDTMRCSLLTSVVPAENSVLVATVDVASDHR
jgi:hypothetical protein